MLVDIGLKFYAVTTHLSDIEVKVFGHRFNRFSGKAQVRRATLSCDSSYCGPSEQFDICEELIYSYKVDLISIYHPNLLSDRISTNFPD